MPRCTFYTGMFTQCTRQAHDGNGHCWGHVRKAERLGVRPEGTCPCVVANHWCGRPLAGEQAICQRHTDMIERRARDHAEQQVRRAEAQLAMTQIVQGFMNEEPRRHWRAVTDIMVGRSRLPTGHPEALGLMTAMNAARRFYMLNAGPEDLMENVFINQWLGIPEEWAPEVPAAPAPAMGQMGRLAADGQNVHTTAVSTQTNSNVDLLLEEDPGDLDTLRCIAGWWLCHTKQRRDFEEVWRVLEDVRHWYNKRTCRKTNDNLYKRVLDGLVMKVLMATDDYAQPDKAKQTELYDELIQRVWEECSEAVGMCCEGHISRLANVLVGFDETFRPPVPVGELLQQKMAAIAELKLSTRHKLQRAMEVLEELKVPVEDRAPWLEALAE
jgi:hypothetical protein